MPVPTVRSYRRVVVVAVVVAVLGAAAVIRFTDLLDSGPDLVVFGDSLSSEAYGELRSVFEEREPRLDVEIDSVIGVRVGGMVDRIEE